MGTDTQPQAAPPLPAPPPPLRKWNAMAIAAVVSAMLPFVPFVGTALPVANDNADFWPAVLVWSTLLGVGAALAFGYGARRQIRYTGQRGRGLAIAALVVAWGIIGSFAVFIVVAFIGCSTGRGCA